MLQMGDTLHARANVNNVNALVLLCINHTLRCVNNVNQPIRLKRWSCLFTPSQGVKKSHLLAIDTVK